MGNTATSHLHCDLFILQTKSRIFFCFSYFHIKFGLPKWNFFLVSRNIFPWIRIRKMGYLMNLRIRTKNHETDSKIGSTPKIDFRADWTQKSHPRGWELNVSQSKRPYVKMKNFAYDPQFILFRPRQSCPHFSNFQIFKWGECFDFRGVTRFFSTRSGNVGLSAPTTDSHSARKSSISEIK